MFDDNSVSTNAIVILFHIFLLPYFFTDTGFVCAWLKDRSGPAMTTPFWFRRMPLLKLDLDAVRIDDLEACPTAFIDRRDSQLSNLARHEILVEPLDLL